MSIYASSTSTNYEPVPAGNYVARCYSMIHIGTIAENYMGEEKEMDKVRIGWELPTELKVFKEGEEAKPLSISKEFTNSLSEKANLRKFLESWRGKGFTAEEVKKFDITKLLGKPCMLSVIHKTSKQGKVYADISSASVIPKGLECPPQVNPNFEFNYMPFDESKFNSLPDWLKDKIKTSQQYKEMQNPYEKEVQADNDNEDDLNSDLPF